MRLILLLILLAGAGLFTYVQRGGKLSGINVSDLKLDTLLEKVQGVDPGLAIKIALVVIGLAILIALIYLVREIFCWFLKINGTIAFLESVLQSLDSVQQSLRSTDASLKNMNQRLSEVERHFSGPRAPHAAPMEREEAR